MASGSSAEVLLKCGEGATCTPATPSTTSGSGGRAVDQEVAAAASTDGIASISAQKRSPGGVREGQQLQQDEREQPEPAVSTTDGDASAAAAVQQAAAVGDEQGTAATVAPDVPNSAVGQSGASLNAEAEQQAGPAPAAGLDGHPSPAVDAPAGEQPTGEPQAVADQSAAPVTPEEAALHDEQQHNFALAKDGAKVLAANKEARKPHALLDDDSDTFMKNDCRGDKWVMLELSQVAKVNRLELSQFELYSARVKEFEAWGRQSHPRVDGFGSEYGRTLNSSHWKLLGNFTAEKAKGSQLFAADQPLWVRYLLLRFLSQHSPESICAVNGVSVFGKSAAEELEDQLASASEEELDLLHPGLEPDTAIRLESPAQPAAQPASPPLLPPEQPGIGTEAGGAPMPPTPASDPGTGAPASADVVSGGTPAQPTQELEQQPLPLEQEQPQELPEGAPGGMGMAPAEAMGADAADSPAAAGHSPELASSDAAPAATQQQPTVDVDADAGGAGNGSSAAGNISGSITVEGGELQPSQGTSSNDSVFAVAAGAPAATQLNSSTAAGVAPANQAASEDSATNATSPASAANAPSGSEQPEQASLGNASSNHAVGAAARIAPGAPAPVAGQASQMQQPQPPAATPPSVPKGKPAAPKPKPMAAPGSVPAASASAAPAAPPTEGLELPLVGLGSKAKKGGSVYDLLVQEIKTAKLQQKLLAKSVMELQRNASAQHAELAGDIASLAATLAKVRKLPTDRNLSEEELAVRVDALVKAHLLHLSSQMLGLQAALASAGKQQHALLCFLAMLGAVLALNATRFSEQWPRAKWAVVLLAAANGLVGVALQLQGGMTRQGFWLQALPWSH